jgi:hypothetical protein
MSLPMEPIAGCWRRWRIARMDVFDAHATGVSLGQREAQVRD